MQAGTQTVPWPHQLQGEMCQAPVSRDGNMNILHGHGTL